MLHDLEEPQDESRRKALHLVLCGKVLVQVGMVGNFGYHRREVRTSKARPAKMK